MLKQFDVPTITTLDQACRFAQKWLPPITLQYKIRVMEVLTGVESSFGTPLLRKYIEFLHPYISILGLSSENKKPRESDCAASGIVFFYGCLSYIIHFPNWGHHIRDIFLYNLLYILVDHYIDDIRIHPSEKNQAIQQMYILIDDPLQYKKLSLVDPILLTIAQVYQELIDRCPSTKPLIFKLFQAEIEGLSIQKDPSLNRDQYYNIALEKGGYTMQTLQAIVGNTDPIITQASFHIGTIMQLIDDSVDVLADNKNGIFTIASYELKEKGNLDDLWIDIMNRIRNIDSRFTLFIFLYTIFAIYLPDRVAECYSSNLRSQTNPLNLFDFNLGCDGSYLLVHAISNELISMDALETINKNIIVI